MVNKQMTTGLQFKMYEQKSLVFSPGARGAKGSAETD
jgi:hypothetical protein